MLNLKKRPISESITLNKQTDNDFKLISEFEAKILKMHFPNMCLVCECNLTAAIKMIKLILFRQKLIDFPNQYTHIHAMFLSDS